jgi:hypothetical protein
VVDLSLFSNEGDLIIDVSWDEEFIRRLFGDLNHDVLGPPGDGKIIILNDSDEEKEVPVEKATNTEVVPSSAMRSLSPTASTDGTYKSNTPDQAVGSCSSGRDETGLP